MASASFTESKTIITQVACTVCGEYFKVDRSRLRRGVKYCSQECRWKPHYIECKQCGEKEQVKKSLVDERNFCSRDCYANWLSENKSGENSPSWKGGEVSLSCKFCDEDFSVKKAREDRAKYCSRSCAGKDKTGEDASNWQGGGKKEYECEVCSDIFKEWKYKEKRGANRFCSKECRVEHRENNNDEYNFATGEDHGMWEGGITEEHRKARASTKYKKWRCAVMERDSFECQLCDSDDKIQVHHIKKFSDYPDKRYEKSNGICLCVSCHKNVTGEEEKHEKKLRAIITKNHG